MTADGVIPVHRPRLCASCDHPAVWITRNGTYLCDDHAAVFDLDELEDLTGVNP